MTTATTAGTTTTEQQRRADRVNFSYEMLGALMGRRPRADGAFSLRPFAARWGPARRRIKLGDLPPEAKYIELHVAGSQRPELLRIDQLKDDDRRWDIDGARPTHAITPTRATADDDIVSLIALVAADGKPVGFGPRLRPLAPPTFVAGWNTARSQILLSGLPRGTTHLEVTSSTAAEVAEVKDMNGVKTEDKSWHDSSMEADASFRVNPVKTHDDPVTVRALPGGRATAVVRSRG